ncbi:MAG: hydroxyacid dehydrogenase [Flavobacteriaceae bacterium]|nr:hydroxyacid dehydrogenase [Flavobacteriaceae bacterium]
MRILHLDENHPILVEQLAVFGFENIVDTQSSKELIAKDIAQYHGLVIRSRFPIDKPFLQKAKNLKFIARVGSGLENIDVKTATEMDIEVLAAPEGSSASVGEHALGMLLSLLNKLPQGNKEVRSGKWAREANRGEELGGKTIGIIGYGHTGKQFARKLAGFDVKVLCHDIINNVGDENAEQVPLRIIYDQADVVSIHLPLNKSTQQYVDHLFIFNMKKSFWLINTSRGNQVVIEDLVNGLKENKVKGACLDVLDTETDAFDLVVAQSDYWQFLRTSNRIILSPHVAGWTTQSHLRLSEVILSKIKLLMDKSDLLN